MLHVRCSEGNSKQYDTLYTTQNLLSIIGKCYATIYLICEDSVFRTSYFYITNENHDIFAHFQYALL